MSNIAENKNFTDKGFLQIWSLIKIGEIWSGVFYNMHVLLLKVATFLPNLMKLVEKGENGIRFSKFHMAAVAMLDAGCLTVFNIIDL